MAVQWSERKEESFQISIWILLLSNSYLIILSFKEIGWILTSLSILAEIMMLITLDLYVKSGHWYKKENENI